MWCWSYCEDENEDNEQKFYLETGGKIRFKVISDEFHDFSEAISQEKRDEKIDPFVVNVIAFFSDFI